VGIAVFLVPASISAAADLPGPDTSPYMQPDVVPTWDGFYVGAEAGGAVDAVGQQATGLAGLHAGYNWQSDRLVLGVRGDGDWRDRVPRRGVALGASPLSDLAGFVILPRRTG
jgi:hypothetical protein